MAKLLLVLVVMFPDNGVSICDDTEFDCGNGNCIHESLVCNGNNDCSSFIYDNKTGTMTVKWSSSISSINQHILMHNDFSY